MKNKKIYMILGGIIILGTIFYFYNKNKNKKIDASTDGDSDKTDDKTDDKPVDKPVDKPNVVTKGTIKPKTSVRPKGCPSKEQMARTKYTKEGMDKLKALGC